MYNLMSKINNHFEVFAEKGEFTIANNEIIVECDKYITNQYIYFIGSIFNANKLFKISSFENGIIVLEDNANNETTFDGYIIQCNVPSDFITLNTKVNSYKGKVSSESIQGYYSATYKYDNGVDAYESELSVYRKPFISKNYFLNYIKIYEY